MRTCGSPSTAHAGHPPRPRARHHPDPGWLKTRTRDDERLIEDLEKRTGISIADLAKLTKEWQPKG
jgi:hypothetical protein